MPRYNFGVITSKPGKPAGMSTLDKAAPCHCEGHPSNALPLNHTSRWWSQWQQLETLGWCKSKQKTLQNNLVNNLDTKDPVNKTPWLGFCQQNAKCKVKATKVLCSPGTQSAVYWGKGLCFLTHPLLWPPLTHFKLYLWLWSENLGQR